MGRKTLIRLFVHKELLFPRFPEDTDRAERLFIHAKLTFNPESIGPVEHILTVGTGEIAFCETEIIDRVQEIGLADTVLSANTSDPGIEIKPRLPVVLKLVE